MSKISSIALESIHRNLERAAQHSHDVISAFAGNGSEPTDALIALFQDLHAVRASTKLIKADLKLDRTVLDILA
ncbi:MAG: hypothetical protein J0M12_14895 [Deltaproteobacteria bacterium]|nr:hypothetical protein [Deltaproteobacteria bacterium]